MQRNLIFILFSLSMVMIFGKNVINDRFTTTDHVGGNKVYTSDSPILTKGAYYQATVTGYAGKHLSNCTVKGRNSDSEDWVDIATISDKRKVSFQSPGDFRQVRFGWNKSTTEQNTMISYSIDEENFDHSVLYVSTSSGSDANSGTQKSPFYSIKKAIAMHPEEIRLRCGDTFYESVKSDDIDFASYGKGAKPVISGLKILPQSAWQLSEVAPSGMKIWKVNLALDKQSYKGLQYGGNNILNNIGGFVRVGKSLYDSSLCGSRRVRSYDDLKKADAENFDFFQPVATPSKNTKSGSFDYVYVCFNGNPDGNFGVISGSNGMTIGNCDVSSISVRYWGRHGIAGKSNVTISGCDIYGIGGMVQLEYQEFVCLGNGIEFYVHHPGISNCHVTGCHISHCYDAGLTVQGSEKDPTNMQPLEVHNVTFTNNTIENCCQSFEEFIGGNNPTDIYYDCLFAKNISKNPGIDTGFRYSDGRYKRSHILTCENNKATGMVYSDNVCTNGNYLCVLSYHGKYAQGTWKGNKCTIKRGQDLLGNYKGTKDVIKVPTDKGSYPTLEAATEAAIALYRKLTGDLTTKFTIVD